MPTIAITPALTGYASITNFLLSSDTYHVFGSAVSGTNWAFGDGNTVRTNEIFTYKTYTEPGIYRVSLLDSTEYAELTVFNFLPESISFENASTTSAPGASSLLVINLTSNFVGPHTVDLYAANSNSFVYNEKGGLWNHLNPQWRFLNDGGKIGNQITTDATTLYYNSALGLSYNDEDIPIGSTAQISAYYIDDMPSPVDGVNLIATNSYGDIVNSRVSATALIFLSAGLPTSLNITTDGIQDMEPFYWQGSNILHVVNLEDANGIFRYLPLSNDDPINITRTFFSNEINITSAFSMSSLSVNAFDDDSFTHTRGYIRDLAKTSTTATHVTISAVASFTVDYDTLSAYNFFTPLTGSQVMVLTGVSTSFEILTSTYNTFRRFNESENFTCLMKDFVNAPTFKNSNNFFDEYFGVIAGDVPVDDQALGQKIMERITNFSNNHNDIDVANLDQFFSLAEQVDLKLEDFGLKYPERLKRIMDVASIEHKKLWGARCPCNQSFNCKNCCGNFCTVCGKDRANNLGDILSLSSSITVGTPVVLKYTQRDPVKYDLYYPKAIGALTAYSLSALTAVDLNMPLENYYQFYTYIDTPKANQVEGVINWDDEYTTITESASSSFEWYGDNQILDRIFNLDLHKGLKLLDQ